MVVRDTGEAEPERTAVGLAARPWAALERLAAAEVVDARVELQDAKGAAYLVLAGLDASLQESGGRRTVRLSLKDGRVGPPQRRLGPVTGEGALTIADGRLLLDAVHLAARGSTLDARGRPRPALADRGHARRCARTPTARSRRSWRPGPR